MELRVPPIKNHYCKKTRLDFGIENRQEDLDLLHSMPTTKQHGASRTERLTKYMQLPFETRERRPGCEIYMVPVVVRTFGGGIKVLKVNLKKKFDKNELLDKVAVMMQKTVLMDCKSMARRVMSDLI